jgi:hypothetical protein
VSKAKLENAEVMGLGNQDLIAKLTAKVDEQSGAITNLQQQVEAMKGSVSVLSNAMEAMDLMKAQVAALVAALANPSPGNSGGKVQESAIDADADDVSVFAPGTVRLNTGMCGEVDLCTVANTATAVQDAFGQL